LNRNLGIGEQNKNSSTKTSRTGFSDVDFSLNVMLTPGFEGEGEGAVKLGACLKAILPRRSRMTTVRGTSGSF
jgi:hypothetical protein